MVFLPTISFAFPTDLEVENANEPVELNQWYHVSCMERILDLVPLIELGQLSASHNSINSILSVELN